MSVYPPSGSGGAHMDKSISGSKKVTAKNTPAKKATKKAAPSKASGSTGSASSTGSAGSTKKALPPFLQPKSPKKGK